jgi:hypothetical protein
MNIQRKKIICWNCEAKYQDKKRASFSHLIDVDSNAKLILNCPYCGSVCKVDLDPNRIQTMNVLKGTKGQSDLQNSIGVSDLSDLIQTTEPNEEDLSKE